MHISSFFISFTIASATASDLHARGIPFTAAGRAGGAAEDVPSPPSTGGTAGRIGDDVDYSPYGSLPRVGEDAGTGSTASEQAMLEYAPAEQPNQCLRGQCLELTREVAKKVIDYMLQRPGESSTTTTSNNGAKTRVQPPLKTASNTRPMPNYEVATAMSLPQEQIALFDSTEQEMYFNDRMCFYANIQQRYADVAKASPTRVNRREDVYGAAATRMTSTTTALAQSEIPEAQSALWGQYLPNHILSIYEPLSANHSMTTATTTCSGLDGSPSVTATYVQARATSHSPTATPSSDQGMLDNGAIANAKAPGSALFGAVIAVLGLIVI